MDYPGVGPEHSFLKDEGRAEYYSVTDDEALEGMESHINIAELLIEAPPTYHYNLFHIIIQSSGWDR